MLWEVKNIFLFLKVMITHKFWVFWYLFKIAVKLLWRGLVHDNSKFLLDECLGYIGVIDILETTTYDSKEYRESLDYIRPSVTLHKERNKHHPEYYKTIEGMKLVDLVEMICDWKAAVKRTDGSMNKSFEVAREKFRISAELERILRTL